MSWCSIGLHKWERVQGTQYFFTAEQEWACQRCGKHEIRLFWFGEYIDRKALPPVVEKQEGRSTLRAQVKRYRDALVAAWLNDGWCPWPQCPAGTTDNKPHRRDCPVAEAIKEKENEAKRNR